MLGKGVDVVIGVHPQMSKSYQSSWCSYCFLCFWFRVQWRISLYKSDFLCVFMYCFVSVLYFHVCVSFLLFIRWWSYPENKWHVEWRVLKYGSLVAFCRFSFLWVAICAFSENRRGIMIYPVWMTLIDRDLFVWVNGKFSENCLLSFCPYLAVELASKVDLILAEFADLGHIYLAMQLLLERWVTLGELLPD